MSEVSREEFEALLARVEELEQRREEDRRRLEQREERIAELEAEVSKLRAAQEDSPDTADIEELWDILDASVQQHKELEDEVEDLADDVETHGEELDSQGDLLELTIEKRKDLRERVHELAREVENGTSGAGETTGETGQTPHYVRPETPLEDLVQLPTEIAEANLSANQQRMRFVAEGVHEYATKVPAGRALPWSDLRRVIAAGQDGQAYSANVGRVMDFFDDFGKDDVEVVERRDREKTVIFDDDLVKRIVAYHNQTAQSNSVVSRNEVYG